jgi:hypothetical protein
VTGRELELEIEFVGSGETPGPRTYHLHIGCLAAWESELPHPELAEGGDPLPPRDRPLSPPRVTVERTHVD